MSTYMDILRAHQRGKLKANEPSQQDPSIALPEPTDDTSPDELLQEEPPKQDADEAARTAETADTPSSPANNRDNAAQAEMDTAFTTPDAEYAPALEGVLPEEPGIADDDASEPMLQEEAGSTSPIPDTDDASRADLPDEPGEALLDPDDGTHDPPSGDMLQEEAAAPSAMSDISDEDFPEESSSPFMDLDDMDAQTLDGLLQEEVTETPPDFSDMDDALSIQSLPDEPQALKGNGPQEEPHEASGTLADEAPDTEPQESESVAASNSIHAWLSGCVMLLVRLYEDATHDSPTDISPLSHHLSQFSAKLHEDPEEMNALELDIANRIESIREAHADNGDLVQKAVMMMLYGFKICVQMHMKPPEITRHVAAAILHNIGMAQIFPDTRLKEGKLTNAERTLIRRVPEKSVDYLKRCGITDRIILLAALQSQERHDGSGPRGLAGTDIALSARIVGLLSMFEALVHVRAYRERLLPRDAIRELVNGQKNRFDPAILKQLIESVSLYPVGTYVQLNSGDIGQVIRVQPRLPLRPKVVLTMDRHGNRIPPREIDLHKQPNLMVQRCMYREGLMAMKSAVAEEEEAEA